MSTFSSLRPWIFFSIGIFRLKTNHLATLVSPIKVKVAFGSRKFFYYSAVIPFGNGAGQFRAELRPFQGDQMSF
jgi:hypothetical protein